MKHCRGDTEEENWRKTIEPLRHLVTDSDCNAKRSSSASQSFASKLTTDSLTISGAVYGYSFDFTECSDEILSLTTFLILFIILLIIYKLEDSFYVSYSGGLV